jgi:RNA polymerase sigma factor for flagellar operon FliA
MPRLRKSELSSQEIEEFVPTVRYWARHYAHRAHQILDVEDLYVVGMMGLMDAARRYNPQRDVLFKTYAEFRIRGEIIDELRRQDWLSRSERRKQKIYRKAHQTLEQNLGRDPTRQEVAKVLPFKSLDLDRIRQYEDHDTLRAYTEGESQDLSDGVADKVLQRDEVYELMTALPPLHRLVVERRYFADASIAVIAQEIGLSEGRVSQLHGEAIEMLRLEAKEEKAA